MARRKTPPGTIRKRGDTYQVALRVKGRRHYFTVEAGSLADVEEFCRTKHGELLKAAKQRLEDVEEDPPFSTFLERYERERIPLLAPRTQQTYTDTFKLFRRFFIERRQDPTLQAIRPRDVTAYLIWRRTHPAWGEGTVSSRTVQKGRATLHAVFEFAIEHELRDSNPVTRTRRPKAEERDPVIVSDAEYERLLGECRADPFLHLYVLTLAETGARSVSEVLRLTWANVDLEQGFIWIPSERQRHRTKSGKGRWVLMTPRLHAAMQEHFAAYRLASYAGKRPEYVFHYDRNRRGGKAGERVRTFRSALTKAIERAKLPEGFRPHDLRHRRATTWLAEGKNPVHLKEALGHSELRTTMGYTHLAREHLRSLVEDQGRGTDCAS
jgi:site-specific recombinase XerD